jgi:hypothetical protein
MRTTPTPVTAFRMAGRYSFVPRFIFKHPEAISVNVLRIKEVAKAIWAKRSEAFYPLLYDPKGKVAKQIRRVTSPPLLFPTSVLVYIDDTAPYTLSRTFFHLPISVDLNRRGGSLGL